MGSVLPGVGHEHHTTQDKPLFPLFGVDSCSQIEATLLPLNPLNQQVSHYLEELIISLSSPKTAQRHYKEQNDKQSHVNELEIFMEIPQEKSGHQKKLSRSSHGPYHVTSKQDSDITVVKVHFPDKGVIQAPVMGLSFLLDCTGMEDLANTW